MRTKNIEARCYKKIIAWTETLPEDLRDRVRRCCVIAGGAIASMLKGFEPKDYDIYLTDGEVLEDVAKHYIKTFAEDPPAKVINAGAVDISLMVHEKDKAFIRWWNQKNMVNQPEDPEFVHEHMPIHHRYRVYIKSAGVRSVEEEQEPYRYFEGCSNVMTTAFMASLRGSNQPNEGKKDPATKKFKEELDRLAQLQNQDDGDEPEEIEVGAASKKGLLRDRYVPVFMTDNCISLSGSVQLILRFYGDVEYILDSFDFMHTKQYYSLREGLQLRQPALESLLTNELRYQGSYYPVCSLFRLRKFLARGMTASAGTIFQIALDVSELDLTKIPVLYEQLIGVDAAYFIDFLNKLTRVKQENPDFSFDTAYLMALVDEVFNEAELRDAKEISGEEG